MPQSFRGRSFFHGFGKLTPNSLLFDPTTPHGVSALRSLESKGRVGPGVGHASGRNRVARAHGRFDHCPRPPARGRGAKKNGPQALGRSQGGFSTKLPLSADARGRPRRFALTDGPAGDGPQAPALLASDLRPGQRVLADKACDADYVRDQVRAAGAEAVIPSKKNRTQVIEHDEKTYKNRNPIERCFNRLKRFRGLASCYEKNASTFLAMVTLGAILHVALIVYTS